MNRRRFAAALPLALPAAAQPPARLRLTEFPAPAFGAAGDGRTLDTAALQKAIDACSAAGGGAVLIPPGVYHTGTLEIRSGVTLRFAPGAKLLGSSNLADYPARIPALRSYTDNYTEKSLIYAEKASDIGMEGPGVIDHQGASFKGPYKVRPYTMRFIECRNVSVRDIRLENSPMWVQHYLACEGVYLTNVTVHSRVNANNDGIDIDACSRVRISDCDIWSGDDAIVLKSTCATPCRDITITNCVLSSACNALKMGTESNGGFLNIAISNCSIYDTRLSGLALEIVDGGTMDGITVAGLQMRNVHCPIFVRLGNRARPFQEGQAVPGQGALRNIVIQGVQATGAGKTGCSLTGLAEAPIENLMLRDIALSFVGGGTAQDAARAIPEVPEKYPEHSMFGLLSAYGFYVRHARGVTLDNVRLRTAVDDLRPAVVAEDVERLRLTGLDPQSHARAAAALRLIDVRRALLQGNHPPAGAPVFARVEGARSAAIHLAANAVPSGMREIETAAGAAGAALVR